MFAFNLPTSNILTIANLAAYNPTYYHQNYTFEPFINYVNITPNSPGYINLGLGLPQLALIEQE
jgi:hypothetical protein